MEARSRCRLCWRPPCNNANSSSSTNSWSRFTPSPTATRLTVADSLDRPPPPPPPGLATTRTPLESATSASNASHQEAENIYLTIVKRFGADKSVWQDFGRFYAETKEIDKCRKLMLRALKSLDSVHR